MMELEEALRKADSFMRENKDYFLCSVFSSITAAGKSKISDSINEWVLHFAGRDKGLDCHVKGDSIRVDEAQSIGEPVGLDISKVKISVDKALSLTRFKNAGTMLLSLHGSPPLWTINFISGDMITTYDVDAETGKITRNKTTSVFKRQIFKSSSRIDDG